MGGINGKTDIFTSIIVGIAGIAMIVLHNRIGIMEWIVIMIGVMFIIPGVFSVLLGALSKQRKSTTSVIAGIGAIALGVIMCAMPVQFAGIMVTIFGCLLIVNGVYHLCFVAWLSRPFVLPFYYYIIPVLLIVTGVVVMFTSVRTINSIVLLVTGIAFVCSSVSSLMEWIATHPSHRNDDGKIEEKSAVAPEEQQESN
ncbi:MAG: DUF308 domain-containing protein [Duncaniella sp.]|nr:DUF308 domain-containing protein [Duncaniella sp.]